MQKNFYPGKFIAFEGIDGSGKTTQASRLYDWFNKDSKKPVAYLTREPTNSMIGGLVRSRLTSDWKSGHECLQLLFSADRAYHLEKEIIPLLKKDIIVITDRYFFSTIAYGAVEIKNAEWLVEINKQFILPDITFIIKVSPRICFERMESARFHIELFEKEEILTRVWQNYENLSKRFKNVNIIDGERPIEEVFSQIKKVVLSQLINNKTKKEV